MAKNLNRYYQAWRLRKQGKTLKEIGMIMGFSPERSRVCSNYVQFALRKKNKDYKELRKIIKDS